MGRESGPPAILLSIYPAHVGDRRQGPRGLEARDRARPSLAPGHDYSAAGVKALLANVGLDVFGDLVPDTQCHADALSNRRGADADVGHFDPLRRYFHFLTACRRIRALLFPRRKDQ